MTALRDTPEEAVQHLLQRMTGLVTHQHIMLKDLTEERKKLVATAKRLGIES